MYELPGGVIDAEGIVQKELVVREMNGYDEELVINSKGKNIARTMTKLLASCITSIGGKKVDEKAVQEMLVGDRNYALLALRMESVGKEMEFDAKCPACQSDNHFAQDLTALTLQKLEGAEREFEVKLENPVVFPDGKESNDLRFRLLTGKDQEEIISHAGTNEAALMNLGMLKAIVDIGGVTAINQDLLKRQTRRVREEIARAIQAKTPGVDYAVECQCAECSKTFKVQMGMENFFMSKTI